MRMRWLAYAAAWSLAACSAGAPGMDEPDEASIDCGPHARAKHRVVVATTTSAQGETIDWIPIESQTPDGRIASPPPGPPPSPVGAPLGVTHVPPNGGGGPPGTIPVLRT